MRAVIQRVRESSVVVDGQTIAEIGAGMLVLLGVEQGDRETEDLGYMADKIPQLRIFADSEGKMNRSLLETGGEMLIVSQFTLLADCRKGRRPNFLRAENPQRASAMLELLRQRLVGQGIAVQTGQFGADMQVHLINDGPVTILLDSRTG